MEEKKEIKRQETRRQAEAFEYYYSLISKNESKATEKTAKKFKVTERTVKNWSKWFSWQDRVVERNKVISEKVAEEVVEQKVEEHLSYLETTDRLVDKLRVMIETASTKVETVKDIETLASSIEKLMRLGLDIQGFTCDTVNTQVETFRDHTEVVNGFTFDIKGKPQEEEGGNSED